MKTIYELNNELSAVKRKKIPRTEKVKLVQAIRGGVSEIERAAASSFSFPLEEVRRARAFLITIDGYLKL